MQPVGASFVWDNGAHNDAVRREDYWFFFTQSFLA